MNKLMLVLSSILVIGFTGCGKKVEVNQDQNITQRVVQTNDQNETNTTVEVVESNVQVEEVNTEDVQVNFEAVYFDFDKSNVKESFKSRLVEQIGNSDVSSKIRIEGNCDRRGSLSYNDNLGLERANSVKSVFVENGFQADNITVVSYGERKLRCKEKTEACHSENRRVDISFQ